MAHTRILLYGADELLGALYLAQAVAEWTAPDSPMEVTMILGGRDPTRVIALGKELNLEARIFQCSTLLEVLPQLIAVDILVLASALDKSETAVIAAAASQAKCHVVDLGLDVDNYRLLDALPGLQGDWAWVRGAGPGSGPSNLLVSGALRSLQASNWFATGCLGAIRVGLDCVVGYSRASAVSVWGGLSRDVTIVRTFPFADDDHPGQTIFRMRVDHVPIGQLERQFDFGVDGPSQKDVRVSSAANLIDTLTAADAVGRLGQLARRVESYVAVTNAARIGYQAGAQVLPLLSALNGSAIGKSLRKAGFDCMPDGPGTFERSREPHTVVIEIEDEERTCVIDWRLRSPNFYEAGARVAVAVTVALSSNQYSGLLSPAEVLKDCDLSADPPAFGTALQGCRLDRRVTV